MDPMRARTALALAIARPAALFMPFLVPLLDLLPAPAAAQSYPSRTVTVVVPFPPGGSVDGVARIMVQKLNETVGQHFIVENRAGGASGMVGANAVVKAAPDGYTLLVSASVHVINPFLYKNVPYDVVNDFTPISLIADGPLIVSTTPSVQANSLKDFFDLVRKTPEKFTFGATTLGSAGHLAIELLKRDAGLDTLVVSYKGYGTRAHRPHERADSTARRSNALVAAARAGRPDQGARPYQPQARRRGS
jgi:tripartite-type tricarboxylate transporter receptor subunit TctC